MASVKVWQRQRYNKFARRLTRTWSDHDAIMKHRYHQIVFGPPAHLWGKPKPMRKKK